MDRDSITALSAENERLSAEAEHYRELYRNLLETCRRLELGLRGQQRERLGANDAQLPMGVLSTLLNREPGEPDPKTLARADIESSLTSSSRPLYR